MKGQLDISFQWIYVIMAGGAFLILFLLIFKACTQGEERRSDAVTVRTAATMLSAAAWEPESLRNLTVEADVSCVGGVLTLSRGEVYSQIERTPVFLPPRLDGRISTMVVPITHEADGTPAIAYGNVLYVIDENTHYYVFDGISVPGRNVHEIAATGAQALTALENEPVPEGAAAIVIVSRETDLTSVRLPDTRAAAYGVNVDAGIVRFYGRSGNALALRNTTTYQGDELMAGAIISGSAETYTCSKRNFAQRVRGITNIYAERATMLLASGQPAACNNELGVALQVWPAGLDDDTLLSRIRDPRLLTAQRTLHELDCPVIA